MWLLFSGRMGWPVIGRTVGFVKDPEFFEKEVKEHGPISKISIFGDKAVVIAGIERIKQVGKDEERAFLTGCGVYSS